MVSGHYEEANVLLLFADWLLIIFEIWFENNLKTFERIFVIFA